MLRIFAIGFTKRTGRQVRATCYAKNSQKKAIRKKMMEIMIAEAQKSTLKELTKKFIQENIGKQITKECGKIFPSLKRTHQKIQAPQETKIRSHKAHGTLLRETRIGEERKESRRRSQERRTKESFGCWRKEMKHFKFQALCSMNYDSF